MNIGPCTCWTLEQVFQSLSRVPTSEYALSPPSQPLWACGSDTSVTSVSSVDLRVLNPKCMFVTFKEKQVSKVREGSPKLGVIPSPLPNPMWAPHLGTLPAIPAAGHTHAPLSFHVTRKPVPLFEA